MAAKQVKNIREHLAPFFIFNWLDVMILKMQIRQIKMQIHKDLATKKSV